MSRPVRSIACVAAASLIAATAATAGAQATEIKFDATADFLKPPAGLSFGEVTGVAINRATRHVYVFQRTSQRSTVHGATAAQLWEFGPDGTFIREIGKDNYGFAFAHTVQVDKDGNIWTSDEGTNMIVKFSPAGRVLLVLGRRDEAVEPPAEPAPGTRPVPRWGGFNRPTDVTWDLEGNIFVSDGYNNSRVVKISPDGRWLKTWGEYGREPGQFNILHTIASDAKGNVYVGDRSNNRIQVFDHDGNPLRIIKIDVPYAKEPNVMLGAMPRPGANPLAVNGAPWAICITPPNAQGTQYLYSADAVPGRIYKVTLDGKVLGVLGDGGKKVGEFGWVHQIACPSENEIYVGEILNWRVQKLTLHPTAAQR
ncbi:MAG: peptidyl-alpha-hydroxyglycine alpha-amidating lyase family protein [Gemmatimonadota bacterium]|nr:peptidyl-alpha-hydroxyglycine alpha-amidating lyase family protein [Gemmatimonadota bacterium]